MGMRNPFDVCEGGGAPLVDQALGTAYSTVKAVAAKLPVIEYLEQNIDTLVTDVQNAEAAATAAIQTVAGNIAAASASAAAAGTSETNAGQSASAAAASAGAASGSAASAAANQVLAAQSASNAAADLLSAQALTGPLMTPQTQVVFTATAGQASWTPPGNGTFIPGTAQVFVNGASWNRTESFDDSSGNRITFVNPLTAGYSVKIVFLNTVVLPVTGASTADLATAAPGKGADMVGLVGANGVATTVSSLGSSAAGKGTNLVAHGASTLAQVIDPSVQADAAALSGAEYTTIQQSGGFFRTSLTKISQYIANLFGLPATPEQYGAVGDGVTDDYPALAAALASGAHLVHLNPSKSYRVSAGIVVPAQATLASQGMGPTRAGYGARIVADLNVPIAVTLGGSSGNNDSAGLVGVVVTRATGVPPAGVIGVQIQNSYGSILTDVYSISHAIGYNFKNNGNTAGINTWCTRIFTGAINDSHIVVDSWPEVRITQSRFGMGVGDYPCNSFIRIQGGSTVNAADGPNTMFITNSHFNLQGGANVAGSFINFANQLPGSISDTGEIHINNVHVETCTAGITSDATWTLVKRINISNLNWNTGGSSQFIALNSATQLSEWLISNSLIFGNITLAPTLAINNFIMSNVKAFAGSFTGASGSSVMLGNSQFTAGLTLAGAFDYLNVDVQCIQNSTLTNTATIAKGGRIVVNGAAASISMLPSPVASGGAALNIAGNLTGNTAAVAAQAGPQIQSDVTGSPAIFRTAPSLAAGAYTVSTLYHFAATLNGIGSGAAITNQYGFYAGGSLTGATTNIGFAANVPVASGNWNFYTLSSAPVYVVGKILNGSNVDDGSGNLLQVNTGISIKPATTTTAPSAGGAGALPATPTGYFTINIGGTARKVAYY